MDRREQEIRLVERVHGEVEVGPNLEWFVIPRWTLVPGWNRAETPILVRFPPGYAVTPPDNFHAAADLRLANGSQPGSTSTDQECGGRKWLMFSFHIESGDWQPHADIGKGHNMLTFLAGVERRLREVS